VVADTLKKVGLKTDVRKGVYEADYESLEPLLPLAAEFGVAMVVVREGPQHVLGGRDPFFVFVVALYR